MSLKALGEKNPYRYRGYRYDTETGYYYLQSRYYNPEWGRFLNADGVVSTGQGMLSHNMFAYCVNNPVIFKDPLGLAHCMSNEYGGGGGFGAAAIDGSGALAATVKGAWYGTVGTIGAIWKIITFSSNNSKNDNSKAKRNNNKSNLPNQGKVFENVKGAPPVDAGNQGKNVINHLNNKFLESEGKNKSLWPEGENGVDLTQEGWLKGEPKLKNSNVRVWDTGRPIGANGETKVNVKYAPSKDTIHGYPVK
ncbi:RHS repeat-associated core domain-containing protein [Clostridium sp. UBA871]|uniref:RHS repeat-associated core domain-containing protein n=1 Tax=Clostridium sp. UBA871 TaxID=1946380 RepID=UPI00321660EC